jgi:hypothetical protein
MEGRTFTQREREESKEIEIKKLEHTIEMENKQQENIWQASCLKLDRRCLIFCNQVFFGLLLTTFSMYKLSKDVSVEEQMVWLSLLSTITGIFLPSPNIKRD